MRAKSVIYRSRVRAIEDAVEAWKCDHDDAMEVRDLEDVMREAVWMIELMKEWNEEAWTLLRTGMLKNVIQTGQMTQKAFKLGLDAADGVAQWIESVRLKGYEVESATKFENAAALLRRSSDDFNKEWPLPDLAQIKLCLAAHDRGESQDVGEWMRELQGENCTAD